MVEHRKGGTATHEHVELEVLLGRPYGERLAQAAREHLERCRRCRELDREVERMAADMRTDREPEPDAAVLRRAAALLPPRPSLVARLVEVAGRLLPAPTLDALSAAPVRGTHAATALCFDGPGLSVRCQLWRGADGVRLVGQALTGDLDSPPPLVACIESDGRAAREAPISEHGLFVIEQVPDPPFDLVLLDADARVRLAVAPAGGRGRRGTRPGAARNTGEVDR